MHTAIKKKDPERWNIFLVRREAANSDSESSDIVPREVPADEHGYPMIGNLDAIATPGASGPLGGACASKGSEAPSGDSHRSTNQAQKATDPISGG